MLAASCLLGSRELGPSGCQLAVLLPATQSLLGFILKTSFQNSFWFCALQGLAGGLALLCLFMTYIQYATAGREAFLAFYSPQAEVRTCAAQAPSWHHGVTT